ncbi:hypothetical protein CAEBREN_06893 [Caenorhabditis brenneri]|uniref:Uncharacterized protein n=1 Tax=Caenorhabditis brenneri TaxID=135651 RepID=G0NKD8_CAEBE|nr:hypothetical protein CAEBREN_06893 [Caenorhabditis brenneri]
MAAETFPIRRIPLIPFGIVLKSMNPVEVSKSKDLPLGFSECFLQGVLEQDSSYI